MEVSAIQLVIGVLTLICGLSVVLARNPVISAIMLMATLFLTGALYFGLGSFFIGATQILVYAGAIAVLFVFIVMLLDIKTVYVRLPGARFTAVLAGITGSAFFLALYLGAQEIGGYLSQGGAASLEKGLFALAKTISLQFLSNYMIPFQVTGLLILGAIMGVVVLGKTKNTHAGEK